MTNSHENPNSQIETTKTEDQETKNLTAERMLVLSTLETEVKIDASEAVNKINQENGFELKPREGGFHLTIIGPSEHKVFKTMTEDQLNKLQEINKKIQKGEGVKINGIGLIDGSTDENIREADKEKKTCFLAIDIPELNEFRASLGLKEKDFHITLGFETGDIHMEIAGQNEKGKNIMKAISKEADPRMANYSELLNLDEVTFGPLDGQEKQKKKEKVKKVETIASYNPYRLKEELNKLNDEIKAIIDIDTLIELAKEGKGKEINDTVKKLGRELRQNTRFVKTALKNSIEQG